MAEYCTNCVRTEERLCQIHTLYFPSIEYVDPMTTLWLLDQRLGQFTNLENPAKPEGEA